MKKIVTILLLSLPLMQWAQDGMHSSGGDGTGDGGSFSYSFGQFAFETFFDGSSSVAQGVQHPWETFEGEVPDNYDLYDQTLTEELLCYNAQQTITVAGDDGPVLVRNTASVEFIAGRNILFLQGFHAEPGSFVYGHITTDGTFCEGIIVQTVVLAPPVEKSTQAELIAEKKENILSKPDVRLYPNPNSGRFTLNLLNFEKNAAVSIYNLTGSVFYRTEMENHQQDINLPFLRKGIYFVRVVSGEEQFVKKMMVN